MSIIDPEQPAPQPSNQPGAPLPVSPIAPTALACAQTAAVAPREPIGWLALVTAVGGMTWFGTQIAYFLIIMPPGAKQKGAITSDMLSAGDFAFLSVVPPFVALSVLVLGDLLAKLRCWIGYRRQQLARGVLLAIPFSFVIIGLMLAGSFGLDWLYRAIGYKHPSEHELLGAMKSAPSWAKVLLLIGACVAAPVFEEMFFRGHVQTLLNWAFARSRRVPIEAGGRARWAAILIASIFFTILHPLWTAPLIFMLSICLGLTYAWTRNLWIPILIHAAFNTFNTLVFLNYR